MKTTLRTLILTVPLALTCANAQQVIPQVADGGGWRSTLVLTNTTSSATIASLSFFQDTSGGATQAWTPTFLEGGSPSALNLAAGSTLFLHTPGTAGAVSQGWAELTAIPGVEGYVIYTYRSAGHADQDATAPAVSATNRILVPFDNTSGLVMALAVVNPNPIAESISVTFRTSGGAVSQGSLPSLPANGQLAFLMGDQFPATKGQSGLAEFYVSAGTISIIALRANATGAFTSAPVYFETGAPIIPTSGGGGGGSISGDITFAGFSVGKVTSGSGVQELIGGVFDAFTPTEWNAPFAGTKIGACTVYDITYATGSKYPSSPDVFLDAGAQLSVGGPNLAAGSTIPATSTAIGPLYSRTLPAGTLADGGTYTLSGSGGTQVAAFNPVSATLPSNFSVTNWDGITAIDRTKNLTVNWTGSGFQNLIISANGTMLSASTIHSVVVTCVAAASLHTFSIPAAALAKLPAITSALTGIGVLSVTTAPAINGTVSSAGTTDTSFTPNLVAGGKINYGTFAPFFTWTKSVTIQ